MGIENYRRPDELAENDATAESGSRPRRPGRPMTTHTQPCDTCGEQVTVAVSGSTGRRVLVAPGIDDGGNIQLRPGPAHTVIAVALSITARFGKTKLHVIHVCGRTSR